MRRLEEGTISTAETPSLTSYFRSEIRLASQNSWRIIKIVAPVEALVLIFNSIPVT